MLLRFSCVNLSQDLVAFGLLVAQIKAMLLRMSFDCIHFQRVNLKGISARERTKEFVPQALAWLSTNAFDVGVEGLKSLDDFRQCFSLHVYYVFWVRFALDPV